MINISLYKNRNKAFFMMHWNVQGQDWIRFDKNNKKFHLKSNCCFENAQDFLPCSRLYLYFQDFFQVWKFAGQILRLFQEFKTLYETWTEQPYQISLRLNENYVGTGKPLWPLAYSLSFIIPGGLELPVTWSDRICDVRLSLHSWRD